MKNFLRLCRLFFGREFQNKMESQILDAALSQGIWAVLFVALLFYILRSQEKRDEKQEEREANYRELLTDLSHTLDIVESIQNDINQIKNTLESDKLSSS